MENKTTVLLNWVIKEDNFQKIKSSLGSDNIKIDNLILNSEEYPYLKNVYHEAILNPNQVFKVLLYINDEREKELVEKIIAKANETFGEKYEIKNLKFEYYDLRKEVVKIFEANKLNMSFDEYIMHTTTSNITKIITFIEMLRIFSSYSLLKNGHNVIFTDFDYVEFYKDPKIVEEFEKYKMKFFSYIPGEGAGKQIFTGLLFISQEKIEIFKNIEKLFISDIEKFLVTDLLDDNIVSFNSWRYLKYSILEYLQENNNLPLVTRIDDLIKTDHRKGRTWGIDIIEAMENPMDLKDSINEIKAKIPNQNISSIKKIKDNIQEPNPKY
jgi:hypothetical protein